MAVSSIGSTKKKWKTTTYLDRSTGKMSTSTTQTIAENNNPAIWRDGNVDQVAIQLENKPQKAGSNSFSSKIASNTSSFAQANNAPVSSNTKPTYWNTYNRGEVSDIGGQSLSTNKDDEITDITQQAAPQQTLFQDSPQIQDEGAWLENKYTEEKNRLQQTELQDINREGQLYDDQKTNEQLSYDRGMEDNKLQEQRALEDTKFNLDQYRTDAMRQREDTLKQRQETLQAMRRTAGALGLNVTSTFYTNYSRTEDKFNRVLDRLATDIFTNETRTEQINSRVTENAKIQGRRLLENYDENNKRIDQDFDYRMRDYKEQAQLEAKTLVEKYGLDDDKLGAKLDELSLQAFNNVMDAYTKYEDAKWVETEKLDESAKRLQELTKGQFDNEKMIADQFMEGAAMMTIQDINALVRDGLIGETTAQALVGKVVQASIDTIDANTLPGVWVQFQDQIIEMINNGSTPTQAIQAVMSSDEFTGVVEEMQKLGVNPYEQRQYDDQHRQSQQNYDLGSYELQMKDLEVQDMLENADGIEWIVAYSENKRGTDRLQCGQLVNDYREKLTGSRAWVGDTFESKAQAIARAGESETPVEWGMFAYSTGQGAPGHVGIVLWVNGDGSIEVLEANAEGNINGAPASVSTYSAEDVSGMLFSQAPTGTADVNSFTDKQKNIMGAMDAKNITKLDQEILKKNWLSESDLYDYKAEQRSGKWTEGLEDYEIKRVNWVMDDMDWDPVTKRLQISQEAYEFADSVEEGENATDNQGLIYAFAKAMDPDSVVREGEYATVQKYAQVWGDKLGMNINRIMNGEEFISEDAKANIVATIKTKYDSVKSSYENLRKNKIKIINDMAWKDIGEEVLPSLVMDSFDSSGGEEAPEIDWFDALRENFDQKYDLNNSALIKK